MHEYCYYFNGLMGLSSFSKLTTALAYICNPLLSKVRLFMIRKFTSLLILATLLLQQPVVNAAPPQKYQPLSVQEKKSACQSTIARLFTGVTGACDGISITRNTLQRASPQNPDSSALNNTELLLIERRLSDKSKPGQGAIRKADVYTYNYQSDTLTHTIINLGNGKTLHSEDVQNVQLPLTEDEVIRSRTIASDNPILRGYLEKEFSTITGESLLSLDQLVVKAFVFLARSMPGQINQAAQACGLHPLCAACYAYYEPGCFWKTAPIIDLSTGVVAQHKTGEQE